METALLLVSAGRFATKGSCGTGGSVFGRQANTFGSSDCAADNMDNVIEKVALATSLLPFDAGVNKPVASRQKIRYFAPHNASFLTFL